jgi:hypothetical protein
MHGNATWWKAPSYPIPVGAKRRTLTSHDEASSTLSFQIRACNVANNAHRGTWRASARAHLSGLCACTTRLTRPLFSPCIGLRVSHGRGRPGFSLAARGLALVVSSSSRWRAGPWSATRRVQASSPAPDSSDLNYTRVMCCVRACLGRIFVSWLASLVCTRSSASSISEGGLAG